MGVGLDVVSLSKVGSGNEALVTIHLQRGTTKSKVNQWDHPSRLSKFVSETIWSGSNENSWR